MNKIELVAAVRKETGMTKKAAEKAVNAVFGAIEGALAEGEKVTLMGFGTFSVKTKPAHEAFNPAKQEKIWVEEKKTPAFKPGVSLRDAVK